MAVKFSQFDVAAQISDIDYLVGYKSTENVQIDVQLLNRTYDLSTVQSGSDADVNLVPNTGTTDTVKLEAGNNITLTVTGNVINIEAANDAVSSVNAGAGISVDQTTGAVTVTNDAPDQTVSLTDGGNMIITGTYPNFTLASNDVVGAVSSVQSGSGISVDQTTGIVTVTNSDPDQTVVLTDGTGITTSGTYPDFTITNSAPDQTVALTGGTSISTSGTYPSFTITNDSPNATHTGDVTGSGALTIAAGAVDGGKISTSADVQINSIGVGTAAPTTAGLIRATNDVVAFYSSDKRLKDNIKPIKGALDKVSKLGGYEFDWNSKQDVYEGHDIGVIAQEVEAVFPELVTDRDNGYKAVKYEKLVPALIEAIKELKAEVESLKSK